MFSSPVHVSRLNELGSQERAVFIRERANGLYGPGAYILANTIASVPLRVHFTVVCDRVSINCLRSTALWLTVPDNAGTGLLACTLA